jgi:hypothetical protein
MAPTSLSHRFASLKLAVAGDNRIRAAVFQISMGEIFELAAALSQRQMRQRPAIGISKQIEEN